MRTIRSLLFVAACAAAPVVIVACAHKAAPAPQEATAAKVDAGPPAPVPDMTMIPDMTAPPDLTPPPECVAHADCEKKGAAPKGKEWQCKDNKCVEEKAAKGKKKK